MDELFPLPGGAPGSLEKGGARVDKLAAGNADAAGIGLGIFAGVCGREDD